MHSKGRSHTRIPCFAPLNWLSFTRLVSIARPSQCWHVQQQAHPSKRWGGHQHGMSYIFLHALPSSGCWTIAPAGGAAVQPVLAGISISFMRSSLHMHRPQAFCPSTIFCYRLRPWACSAWWAQRASPLCRRRLGSNPRRLSPPPWGNLRQLPELSQLLTDRSQPLCRR